MVYVKLIRNTYGNLAYLKQLHQYVFKGELRGIGGYGVNPFDTNLANSQMVFIKVCYGKVSSNPLIHIMISLDQCAQAAEKACEYADKFARYFKNKYQVIWAVHEKKRGVSRFHVHLIINSVSYVNGKMFHGDIGEMNAYSKYISKLTNQKVRFEFELKTSNGYSVAETSNDC
ncbi:MAG: relaxase/mobilization nuclease domain-containing protein [Oscillospiraceae bacterium]|nr:relaxase/mobilization nuclease domain-containing protein [Oscillospiraceae bacterium]MBR3448321.1 relaxase/mobilization nuclease domain-containing protein [Oscillospiraceae bacterium]